MTAARKPAARRTTTTVPATAKKPQDRKPKDTPAEKATVERTENDGARVTYRGLTVTIDPDVFNDYRVIKLAGSNVITDLTRLIPLMFGEQEDAIMELCTDPESGRVLFQGPGSMSEFVEEVFGAFNPNS